MIETAVDFDYNMVESSTEFDTIKAAAGSDTIERAVEFVMI